MSDYTLPPVPPVPPSPHSPSVERKWTTRERHCIAAYGHAVAAPLLARIAEMEAEVNRWREIQVAVAQLEGAGPEWPDHGNAPLAITAGYALHKMQADRLRAEVEALRADKERIEEVQNEYLRIDPFEMRTPGGDDADVGWRIYTHHQQTPRLREVACHYDDDLRAAIDTAIAARKGEGSEG